MTISLTLLIPIAVAAFLLGLLTPLFVLIYLVWTAKIN